MTTLAIRSGDLQALHDYWQGKCNGRIAPARTEIVPPEIKSQLRRIFIVEIVGTPPRFRFRRAGTAIVNGFGEEITGRFLDELDLAKRNNEIAADYHKVIATRAPVCSRWRFLKADLRPQSYERLLMPLSSDGTTVDMILGGAARESMSDAAD